MSARFRVGVTRDFLKPDGSLSFGDIGLKALDRQPGVEWKFLEENTRELRPDQVRDLDGLLLLTPRITASTLEGPGRLLLIARFGVGYDNVDVEACTRAGVALTITPDGVRRPVATGVLTFILALTNKLRIKDRLIREGRWAEKVDHMGMGLTGKTLGVVGLGNIGREVFVLARPLGMKHLACDPHVSPPEADRTGVELVDLESLMRRSDFVAICCALTPETRHLIGAEMLGLMKPTAYLINVARGPVVDQAALTAALREGRIQGAGLDVFEQEPIDPADPILALDSVILAPHAIAWTDESFSGNGRQACQSLLDVASGRTPPHLVNREVLDQPRFRERLEELSRGGV